MTPSTHVVLASTRRMTRILAAGAVALGVCVPACGQDYPAKPVHVIIPFAPGGASDFVARIVLARFAEVTGQQALIDNRPGAAGNIAMELAARAAPDGYTAFFGNVGTIAVNPSLYATLAVNPTRDFVAVTRLGGIPGIMVVHPSFPATTVKQLIAVAKKTPGAISYGSPGQGSGHRILMELFKQQAGIDLVEIPYKGGAGPAVTGLVGGETAVAFVTTASVIQFVKAGRLRAIATMTEKRLPLLPDVPTLPESGFPGIVDSQWQGVFLPRGTASNISERLNTVLNQLVRSDSVRQRLAQGFAEPIPTATPAEFAAFVAAESRRWAQIVSDVGAKID